MKKKYERLIPLFLKTAFSIVAAVVVVVVAAADEVFLLRTSLFWRI